MVCLCKGAAFSNALIVLRRVCANNIGLFHLDPEVFFYKVDGREN